MKKILFDNNKNVISEQMKLYRERANISQAQLAARMQTFGINIDQQMVSRIENNQRQVTDYELACICRLLDVSTEDMLAGFYKKYKMD